MWKRKLHFINPLFVILASVLLVTCATPPVKPPPTILPLPEGAGPLIQAKLGEIEINTQVLPKKNPVYQSGVGGPFIDGFRTFLASPGLFKDSARDVINVHSTILALRNIGDEWVLSRSVEATVKYELRYSQ